jgi:hypothetical protein
MNAAGAAAAGAAALALAAGGVIAATSIGDSSSSSVATTPPSGCNDWPGTWTQRECFAAGAVQTALANIQPAVQFCKWRAANPGEWSRLQAGARSGVQAASIVTWMGSAVRDQLDSYRYAGAPPFELAIVLPPNACGGKLLAPPAIAGVTPGPTDATVTIAPSG